MGILFSETQILPNPKFPGIVNTQAASTYCGKYPHFWYFLMKYLHENHVSI